MLREEDECKLTAVRVRIYKPMGGFSALIFGKMAEPSASVMNFLTTETMKLD